MKRLSTVMSLLVLLLAIAVAPMAYAQDLEIGTAPATPEFDTTFTDVSDYWSIAWDDQWTVAGYQVAGDGELLQLTNGIWNVTLEGPIFASKMPEGFTLGDSRTALKDLISATKVTDPISRPNGRPLRHYTPGRSWEMFNYQDQSYVFLDVRVLDDQGAFLYITAQMAVDPAAFNDSYEDMLLLLENILPLRR